MEITRIPLVDTVRFGGRAVDAAAVKLLAESMGAVGLLNAITVTKHVRNEGPSKIDTYWIVAGKHRVQAARDLGWTEIDAVIVDMDAVHAELCEIDENLIRSELTDSQRATAHARREAIMVSLGLVNSKPGPKAGDSAKSALTPSYATTAAAELGVSRRTIENDLRRGKKITPDVLAEISGTSLDKGVVLDELAATPREDQRAKLAEITLRREEIERTRRDVEKINRNTDRVIALSDADELAEILHGRFDLDEVNNLLIARLVRITTSDLIAALKRGPISVGTEGPGVRLRKTDPQCPSSFSS